MGGIAARGLGLAATCMWRTARRARAAIADGDLDIATDCARTLQQIADHARNDLLRDRATDAYRRITEQVAGRVAVDIAATATGQTADAAHVPPIRPDGKWRFPDTEPNPKGTTP